MMLPEKTQIKCGENVMLIPTTLWQDVVRRFSDLGMPITCQIQFLALDIGEIYFEFWTGKRVLVSYDDGKVYWLKKV